MEFNINLWSTSTRYRTTQHAYISLGGYAVEGRAYFINRPWEVFYYQSAILDALRKIKASKANINYISNKCTSEYQAKKYLNRYLKIVR